MARFGRTLESRDVAGIAEYYVTGRVSGTKLEVYIYEDEAQFGGENWDCRFEVPDFDSQTELMDAFLKKLSEALAEKSGVTDE